MALVTLAGYLRHLHEGRIDAAIQIPGGGRDGQYARLMATYEHWLDQRHLETLAFLDYSEALSVAPIWQPCASRQAFLI